MAEGIQYLLVSQGSIRKCLHEGRAGTFDLRQLVGGPLEIAGGWPGEKPGQLLTLYCNEEAKYARALPNVYIRWLDQVLDGDCVIVGESRKGGLVRPLTAAEESWFRLEPWGRLAGFQLAIPELVVTIPEGK